MQQHTIAGAGPPWERPLIHDVSSRELFLPRAQELHGRARPGPNASARSQLCRLSPPCPLLPRRAEAPHPWRPSPSSSSAQRPLFSTALRAGSLFLPCAQGAVPLADALCGSQGTSLPLCSCAGNPSSAGKNNSPPFKTPSSGSNLHGAPASLP
ncbi:uncharacterized protein [Zea mays]|uniref:uncharacterized protein n=1 Tax=Zea mays TaxID=4577 RepID=UPI0002214FA6|nr:uncharacterized protein LOC109943468 [Zea mays]|eukprot:XP_020402134.1 uncharacterized protein LOC109943468 [Zea mays]